jgi:hypothetical protein
MTKRQILSLIDGFSEHFLVARSLIRSTNLVPFVESADANLAMPFASRSRASSHRSMIGGTMPYGKLNADHPPNAG